MSIDDTQDRRTCTPFRVRIVVHQGAAAGATFDRIPLPAIIGRGDEADVQLSDPAKTISRRHAMLGVRGGRLTVQDLSSNGTRVGNALLVPGEAVAADNVPIWLGHHTMITAQLQEELVALPVASPVPAISMPGPLEPAAGTLTIKTLGITRVLVNGQPVPDSAWQSRKATGMLVYLAHNRGRPQDPDRLSAVIWPDMESVSRTTLQSTLSRIRRALRDVSPQLPDPIENMRGLYVLSSSLLLDLDVQNFEHLCAQATQTSDPIPRAQQLQTALALYAGPFLAGYAEEWVESLRTRLESMALDAMEGLSRSYEEQGRYAEAVASYDKLQQQDPCREAAHAGLIRCNLALGRRDDAVRQCLECARLLRKHLHISPGPEVYALYRSLVEEEAFPTSG